MDERMKKLLLIVSTLFFSCNQEQYLALAGVAPFTVISTDSDPANPDDFWAEYSLVLSDRNRSLFRMSGKAYRSLKVGDVIGKKNDDLK